MLSQLLLTASVLSVGVLAQGPISVQCHQTCGRALTAYDRCKGPSLENCICHDGSQFRELSDECLKCGEAAWYKYGHGLQYPLQVCKIDVPYPELPEDQHTTNKVSTKPVATSSDVTTTEDSHQTGTPGEPISVKCHQTCGRALTAYNRCKGPGLEDCICHDGSQFRELSDECLKCGEAAWNKYGHGLQYPLQVCQIDVPYPDPADNKTSSSVAANPTSTAAEPTETKHEDDNNHKRCEPYY